MSRLLAAVSLLAGLRRSRDADPVAFADIICRVLDEDIAEVHAVS